MSKSKLEKEGSTKRKEGKSQSRTCKGKKTRERRPKGNEPGAAAGGCLWSQLISTKKAKKARHRDSKEAFMAV